MLHVIFTLRVGLNNNQNTNSDNKYNKQTNERTNNKQTQHSRAHHSMRRTGRHKLLHITKFTHTINGCCAPNAGLQLSCPKCMASLSEHKICCTSASKPGGGKRGRLGGSLQSHLNNCSCKPELHNEAQLQPAQLLLQGRKNNTPVVRMGSMTATTNQVGQPATFFWSSSTKR